MIIENKWTPVIIAVAIAIIALIYYVASGRSSYDLNTRELSKDSAIENINASDTKKVAIKCKTGENYEIEFDTERTDYQGLIFNACGEEGGEIQRDIAPAQSN